MYKARVRKTLVGKVKHKTGVKNLSGKSPWENLNSDILHCHIQFPHPDHALKLQFCSKRSLFCESQEKDFITYKQNYFLKILFHDSHVTNMSRDCSDRYKYMVYGFYSEFLLALSLSLVDLWIAFLSPIRSFSAFAFQIGSFSQADRLTRPNLRNVFIILFIAPIFSPISGRSLRAPRASSPSSCSISFRTKLISCVENFQNLHYQCLHRQQQM